MKAKIWQPSNVYPTAKLGEDVSIACFCEIGNNVVIGDRTRVGAFSFICEGVTIGKDVFIGPHCCFSNDKFPPAPKEKWQKTIVEDGARLGAGVKVIPGVTIGKGALIGMGSVVTKNVPAGEKWSGVPAKKMVK